MQEIQNFHHRRGKLQTALQKDILGLIKKGDLMPFGFKEPRNIQDKPIKIPADLFFSSEINWDNSELKNKSMEFSGIRLLRNLIPAINIEPGNSEFPGIRSIENSKSRKPEKLNFSELEPDRYINEKQAAEYLGISFKTLQGYRVKGGGPEYSKFSPKMVRYQMGILREWAENRKKKNTSQY